MNYKLDIKSLLPSKIIDRFSKKDKVGKADIHIHSNFSDGQPAIEEILDYVQYKTDLNVIAITDHDTIAGAELAHTLAHKKQFRFEVIIGEEVSCLEGHLLALFINKTIPPGLSLKKVLKIINEQKGIAIASHPFYRSKFRSRNMIVMDGLGTIALINNRRDIDGIETGDNYAKVILWIRSFNS